MRTKTIVSLFLFVLISITTYAQDKDSYETGKASYYGKKFHNRKTASGIPYKNDAYTCAHKTYPFGTKLLVRNPKNDKTVVVEVTDRGPYRKGFLVDLSYIAAKELDIVHHGILQVQVSEYEETDSLAIQADTIPLALTEPTK